MKELVPNKKSRLMPFAQSVQETLDKLDVDNDGKMHISDGCIFEDGKFACISKGDIIEVVNIKTGLRSSACDFSTGDQKLIVTCVVPCRSKFLVGLRCDNATNLGMVCIYDPGVSRVVKTIKLSAVPLSISVIREFGGVGYETSLLSDGLRCMFGIVAVGTEDGHLYLIDMRADDDGEDCSFIPLNTLLFIDTSSNANAPKMRDKARLYGQYCCVDLTSSLLVSTYFKYVDPDGNTLKMYNKGNCGITSLLYLPQSVSLVVGYSFGSFQIWSLKDLQIQYSSAVLAASSPVSHFAFQEPENDPRHCCFLWVGRGPLPSQTECYSPTSITLYQMLYGIKQDIDGYGVLYKQLDVVARRFEHQLTADAHHLVDSTSVGSRIITFKTLDSSDSTVCMIVWETPINDANLSISCHLGIFDLNCYYEKQLPRSIRDAMYGKMEAVCPFFAFYSLTDIAEDFLPGGILDVFMDMKTLQWFRTNVAPQIEQFSWPSSASFKLTCLSEIGTIDVEMLGMQKQIIADMIKMGTDSFLDIGNLIESCCVAGLLQNSFGARQQSEDKSYPDALLSIALEHNGMIFITSCIKKWAHGSITHAGHSLKLVYDWAWSQVIQRKRMLDDLGTALFDSVVETLEAEQLNQLKTISSQLKDLSEILNELKHSNAITLDEGTQELEMRHQVTSHISMYTDILLLLVDCTLLPERVGYVDNSQSNKITYNSNMLADYYEMHRTSSGNEDDLFIDLMWRGMEFPDEVKDENENDVLYPPQSVEIMCHLYIHNMSNDKEKTSCPFYYWFLDVCECYGQLRSKNVQSKFKQLLNLNYDDEMLVKSAWLIDHKLYHEASSQLLMIDVKISSLYYHHIVKLFYKHGEMDLLALFLANKEPNNCCTFEQVKFLICVLLQMGKLSNAYKLQTTILCASQKERLFNYFIQQCIQNKQLQRLMMLPLTMEEENMLHTYLVSSKGNEDYLLVYYLERGMFSKAQEVTKKLRAVATVNLDEMNQEHLQTQCLLVEGFSQVIPEIQQKVNESMEKFPRDTTGNQNCKTPLSSLLIKGDPNNKKPVLYNSLFNSNMYDRSAIKKVLMNSTTRRRKSPLFDTEPVSPKKQKEMDATVMNIDMSVIDQSERRGSYDATNPFALLSTPVSAKRNYSRISSIGLSKRPQSILKLKPDVASEVMSPVLSSNKRIRFVDLLRSPTDSTSSMDGSFLENQSTEIPVIASEASETSIVSTLGDIPESENLISNAVNENDKSLVASTPHDIDVAVEAVNETSAHIESILQDLQNVDEELPDDLNTSKRLSVGAQESVCEIMKLREKLTPSTVEIENVDRNVEIDENALEAESSATPTVDFIVEADLPTENKYTPVSESPTESVMTSDNGISCDTSLLSSGDILSNIPQSNVYDVLSDDAEAAGYRSESVVRPTEEGILPAVVPTSEDETTSEIILSTVDDRVASSVVNLEQSFENHITDDSGPCDKASAIPATPSEVSDAINVSQQISVADVSGDFSDMISNVEDATCVNVLSGLPSTPTQNRAITNDADLHINDDTQEEFSTPLEDPVHDKEFFKNDSMEIKPYTVNLEQGEDKVASANLVTHVEEISDDEGEEGEEDDSLGSSCEDESMSDSGEEEGNSFSDEKSVVSLSSSDSNDAQNVSFTSTDRGEDLEDDGDVVNVEKAGSIKRNEGVSPSDNYSKIGSAYPPSDSGISLEDPQMKLSEISRSAESMVDILPGDVCDEEQGQEIKDKERESMCQIRDSGVFSRESMLSESSPDKQISADNEDIGSSRDEDVENVATDMDRGETNIVTVVDTDVHRIPDTSTFEMDLTTQPKPDDGYVPDVNDEQVQLLNEIEPQDVCVESLDTSENKEDTSEMTPLDASEISQVSVVCKEEERGSVDEVHDDDKMNISVAMVADNSSVSIDSVAANVGDLISNMPSDMPFESESCRGITDVTQSVKQSNDQCEATLQQNDQVLGDADVCIIDDDDDEDEDDDRDEEDVSSEDTDDSDTDDEDEEDNEEKIEDGDNFDVIDVSNLQNVVYSSDSFRKEVEGTCSRSTLSAVTSPTINTPFVVASTVAAPSVTDSHGDAPTTVVLDDDDHDDDGDNEEVEAVENCASPTVEKFTDDELDYKPRGEGDSVNETDNKAYYKISYDDDDKAPSPVKERIGNQHDLSKIGSVPSPEITTYPADLNLAVSNASPIQHVAESEDTRSVDVPNFEGGKVEQVNLTVEDQGNVLISEDIEMKISSSADDRFLTDREHQLEEVVVASQDENEDEDVPLSLKVGEVIEDADKPTISDDVSVESALEYDAESEVIPYSYNDENFSHASNIDLSEEDEKMEEVNLKNEDFREKMDWESNSEESESLPKTSTGKLPIFLPTKVTEESAVQKSSRESSSDEDKGSVITPVRALRRRTVYRKDTLTPRTNKFRVKPGDEPSRDAGGFTSTNDSDKEVPIVDSDAPVYLSRYDNAKNIHEMKKESNVRSDKKEGNKRSSLPKRATRSTRSSGRSLTAELEKDESYTSNSDRLNKERNADGKKKADEKSSKYFKKVDGAESSSDDIEIQSADLEVYLGLTRRKARRTRKSLKSGISPILEEAFSTPYPSKPGRSLKNVTDAVGKSDQDKKTPAQLGSKEEEDIDLNADADEGLKRQIEISEVPPEKRLRLNQSVNDLENTAEDNSKDNSKKSEEPAIESTDDSTDDDDSPPIPRVTRGQSRASVRQTRSHGVAVQPELKTPMRSRKKSPSKKTHNKGPKSSYKAPIIESTVDKTPANISKIIEKREFEIRQPEIILERRSFSHIKKLGDDEEEEDNEELLEEADNFEGSKNETEHFSEESDGEAFVPRITRSKRDSFSVDQSVDKSSVNTKSNVRTRESTRTSQKKTVRRGGEVVSATKDVSKVSENISLVTDASFLVSAVKKSSSTNSLPPRTLKGRLRKNKSDMNISTADVNASSFGEHVSSVDTAKESLDKTTKGRQVTSKRGKVKPDNENISSSDELSTASQRAIETVTSEYKDMPSRVITTVSSRKISKDEIGLDRSLTDTNVSSAEENVFSISERVSSMSISSRRTRTGRLRKDKLEPVNKIISAVDDRVSGSSATLADLSNTSNDNVSPRKTRTDKPRKKSIDILLENESSTDESISTAGRNASLINKRVSRSKVAMEESFKTDTAKVSPRKTRGRPRKTATETVNTHVSSTDENVSRVDENITVVDERDSRLGTSYEEPSNTLSSANISSSRTRKGRRTVKPVNENVITRKNVLPTVETFEESVDETLISKPTKTTRTSRSRNNTAKLVDDSTSTNIVPNQNIGERVTSAEKLNSQIKESSNDDEEELESDVSDKQPGRRYLKKLRGTTRFTRTTQRAMNRHSASESVNNSELIEDTRHSEGTVDTSSQDETTIDEHTEIELQSSDTLTIVTGMPSSSYSESVKDETTDMSSEKDSRKRYPTRRGGSRKEDFVIPPELLSEIYSSFDKQKNTSKSRNTKQNTSTSKVQGKGRGRTRR